MPRKFIAFMVLLISSTRVWAQFEHPDLKKGKLAIKSIALLPANVTILKSGVKANEEVLDISRKLEIIVPPVIAGVLRQHGCTVDDTAFSTDLLGKNPDLKYGVADIQKRFADLYPKLQKHPKDVLKGRFTIGDEVARLNPSGATDALIFVRGTGHVTTGGKRWLGGTGSLIDTDSARYDIAVVDARTGVVLYYVRAKVNYSPIAQAGANSSAANAAEAMQTSIETAFKDFPRR